MGNIGKLRHIPGVAHDLRGKIVAFRHFEIICFHGLRHVLGVSIAVRKVESKPAAHQGNQQERADRRVFVISFFDVHLLNSNKYCK